MQEIKVRQKVSLSDNLPKIPAQNQIEQLRKIYEDENLILKYISPDTNEKYEKNFHLFDRNGDQILNYDQLKEYLISIGHMIKEEDLVQFYKCLLTSLEKEDGYVEEGIRYSNANLIVLKKMIEEDVEHQLKCAFEIVDFKNEKTISSEQFKQFLMTMGYKWSEDQADEFIKQFEPKSQKKINPPDVIKKLMKR